MSVDSDRIQILIIDDNPSLVNIFTKILEIKGFSVTSESTFKKGLQRLQKDHFQAAFIDAPLDGHDEKQILTTLFENKIFTKTPVFLFSSVEFDNSELNQWKNNGLYSYLKKPIQRSKIIKELEILRSNFKINSSPKIPDTVSDDEEPTTEQFEKLTRLEKQIHELETKNYSDKQESTPEEITVDLSSPKIPDTVSDDEEPTTEQFEKLTRLEKQIHELETTRKIEPKSIPGKLLLQNIINTLKSSKINSVSSTLSKNNVASSINVKETIQNEIQKTLSDLSILKKELQLFDDESNKPSINSKTKRKLKKSATPTKRKLKKSATPTKRKLKKKLDFGK